jgi:lysophospholipase L1-like esterase
MKIAAIAMLQLGMLSAQSPIVALGDSVTKGVRPDGSVRAYQTFAAILAKRLGRPVVNAGTGGNTSTQMLARLETDVLKLHPRALILMAGLNDAAYIDPGPVARATARVSLADFEKNLTAIVNRARSAKARTVILTPNPMTRRYRYASLGFYQTNDINEAVLLYAEAARRVARVTNSCLVDVFAAWIAEKDHRTWLPDGIHPNAKGHGLIAGQIVKDCRTPLTATAPASPPGEQRKRTTGTAGGSSRARQRPPSAGSTSRPDR